MSTAVNIFVHAIHKHSLVQEVAYFGFPGWIPMIRLSFCSSCVALQCETGTKFSCWAVPETHNSEKKTKEKNKQKKKKKKFITTACVFFYCVLEKFKYPMILE